MLQRKTRESNAVFANCNGKKPLSARNIWTWLTVVTQPNDGPPIIVNVGGALCARIRSQVDGQPDSLRRFGKATEFFSWLHSFGLIEWVTGKSHMTKDEFFHFAVNEAPKYAWATSLPHFPKQDGILYLCDQPKPANNKKLTEFLKFFCFASNDDRELARAMVLTPFAGLPHGESPSFVITTPPGADGIGAGKTSLAEFIAAACGGAIGLMPGLSAERMAEALVVDDAIGKRIALIDNLKSDRFSCAALESMMTAPEIRGRVNYLGPTMRPNDLTFVITVNGPSFSGDIASRSIVVRCVSPPSNSSPTWKADVETWLSKNQRTLLQNIAWYLAVRSPKPMPPSRPRHKAWRQAVLARTRAENLESLLARIDARRDATDADSETRSIVIEHILRRLEAHGKVRTMAARRLLVPSAIGGELVREVLRDKDLPKAIALLKRIGGEEVRYTRTNKGFGFVVRGKDWKKTNGTEKITRSILDRTWH